MHDVLNVGEDPTTSSRCVPGMFSPDLNLCICLAVVIPAIMYSTLLIKYTRIQIVVFVVACALLQRVRGKSISEERAASCCIVDVSGFRL
jgi:hypothetical protein